jgi:hypothetical protein
MEIFKVDGCVDKQSGEKPSPESSHALGFLHIQNAFEGVPVTLPMHAA